MVRFKTISLVSVGCLSLCISSAASAAELVGSINAEYLFPNSSTVLSSSVLTVGTVLNCPGGGGVCQTFVTPTTILANASSITLSQSAGSSYTPSLFNGVRFSGLTFNNGSFLNGFSLETDLPGLTTANISFTGSSIEYNAAGLSFTEAPYFIRLGLQTSTAGAVPEPATWAMMLLGFGFVGGAMRAAKRRQTVNVSYA